MVKIIGGDPELGYKLTDIVRQGHDGVHLLSVHLVYIFIVFHVIGSGFLIAFFVFLKVSEAHIIDLITLLLSCALVARDLFLYHGLPGGGYRNIYTVILTDGCLRIPVIPIPAAFGNIVVLTLIHFLCYLFNSILAYFLFFLLFFLFLFFLFFLYLLFRDSVGRKLILYFLISAFYFTYGFGIRFFLRRGLLFCHSLSLLLSYPVRGPCFHTAAETGYDEKQNR